ncbi:MAG: trpC [Ferruginibacter sp.]|uniref:indole-3-glycerol phosphate synthase TrpC n=1 Tax=Ferruginibacter sp. TaxID=1940288 RepID=UPI002659061A|nr:indole-3-glycerol phosphate synthase TrpC [Ferruginibacter sp.]MDB5277150.1 trpC [Ferruginibacter sp.]
MNILDTIIAHKKIEVAQTELQTPVQELVQSALYNRPTLSLKQFLLDEIKTGIIAEFKRQSPSRGIINDKAEVVEVTKAYTQYGASCLSVLTDQHFFGGSNNDLIKARVNNIPILRKDFIVDEYQITEAKSIGADVILLIAACLTPQRVEELARFAKNLQLEVLLEIHCEEELQHICSDTEIVGVNNRDLKTFTVDINRSIALSKKIPADKIKIAESGINDIETIGIFKNAGFKGFLIGENFMKQPDPAIAFAHFVQQLNATNK